MDWFAQLKQCLAPYYPAGQDADIVGYLQGSDSPAIWRNMLITGKCRPQAMLLGSVPPTREQWIGAGVAHRNMVVTVRLDIMTGLGVVYEGFMMRPSGFIVPLSDPRFAQYADQLDHWRRNDNPAWHVDG